MPSLLVLAAGMGSRYGGLKQVDPMGPSGETVLDYSVFDAIRAGFDHVIFVIREDFADAFKEGIGSRFAGRIKVDYAFQKLEDLPEPFTVPKGREKPWGTAHAIRAARHLISGPFAVINADDFYGQDSYVKAFGLITSSAPNTCGMVGFPLLNTLSENGQVNRGICQITDENLLKSVEEFVNINRSDNGIIAGEGLDGLRRELDESTLVSMNFWVFPANFVQNLEAEFVSFLEEKINTPKSECYIPTVVDTLISAGKTQCRVLETSSSWFGVTYPEDKAYVVSSIHKLISQGIYPESLA